MMSNSLPCLLAIAVCLFSATMCMAADAHRLAISGTKMDAAAVTKMEADVVATPDDVAKRTQLIGYYSRLGVGNVDATNSTARHVIWLIRNAPDSEILGLPYCRIDQYLAPKTYRKVEAVWQKATKEKPDDPNTLRNASKFFLLSDRDVAEKLLLQGQSIDADDPQWSIDLGRLYSLGLSRIKDKAERREAADKSFVQFKRAFELSDGRSRDSILDSVAKSAFESGRMDDAKKFAELMLEDNTPGWNFGNRIHHGNLILGRVALSKGDLAEAKSRLISAGKTPGSPQLDSFGPNMMLAKELLAEGESDVVLYYFNLCDKFWDSPHRGLDQWIKDVKEDRVPKFGGNLEY